MDGGIDESKRRRATTKRRPRRRRRTHRIKKEQNALTDAAACLVWVVVAFVSPFWHGPDSAEQPPGITCGDREEMIHQHKGSPNLKHAHLPLSQHRQAPPFFVLSVSWSGGLCFSGAAVPASSAPPPAQAPQQACRRMEARRRRTRRKTRRAPRTPSRATVRTFGGV